MQDQKSAPHACPECGFEETEAVAHLGSYCVRCAGCGANIVATSLIAILGRETKRNVEARLDHRGDRLLAAQVVAPIMSLSVAEALARAPTISGRVEDVGDTILAIAAKGVHLVLVFSKGQADVKCGEGFSA